jgi:hypothetical protein
MTKTLVVACAAVLLAGCSPSTKVAPFLGGTGQSQCTSWVGQTITADQWIAGCRSGDALESTTSVTCTDGRTLIWNNDGWNYIDETPFVANVAGQTSPEAEMRSCLRKTS